MFLLAYYFVLSVLTTSTPDAAAVTQPARRHMYWRITVAILVVYLLYLPFSGYTQLYHDSLGYWFSSIFFHKQGSVALLNYNESLRGYLYPLTLFPWRVAQFYTNLPQLLFTRTLGALVAAAMFGWLGPTLWETIVQPGRPLSWPRCVLFAALGFLFWRDYFNFPLTDFPAFGALALAVGLAYRPKSWLHVAGAGVCAAAAANFRPVYLVALPPVAVLVAVAPVVGGWQRVARVGALLVGMAVVMLPQLAINLRHFNEASPLVLAKNKDIDNLYLMQLHEGLQHQKYETNIGPDYPSQRMFFPNAHGAMLLQSLPGDTISSYEQYVRELLLKRPVDMARVYLLHLFNGLDIQYSTPYIPKVYTTTWGLAWVNYSVWFGALLLAVRSWRRLTWHKVLVLGALLIPCAAVLPVCMECRFLVPMHLLMCAVVCFGWPAAWRPSAIPWPTLVLVGVAYVGFVVLCFLTSAQAQATLQQGGRLLW